MVASKKNFPLLAELLADQQRLQTPVAQFASDHAAGLISALAPRPPALIPLSAPKPGEQYAFEVDLDSCTGCKSCVAACHSLNGLDHEETWRDVGLLVSDDRRHPFTQTVTTACHHCTDPACLNGCPVLAYEKDPITGIVRHLDDQCIGCQYCILKCPYDAPKYNARLGIVRKCDMCHSRLAEGEAPACAQACPTHAIKIVTVSVPSPISHLPTPSFLPGAPAPDYTQPTTRYVGKRKLPANLVAADATALRPQPPHWPLVFMLTLLPAAVGLHLNAAFLSANHSTSETHYITLAGLLVGLSGLIASVFHLGQPLRAWRIFLGWRQSWLSREALLFGAWLPVAAASLVFPPLVGASAMLGLAGLACSAMIYIDTRRQFWRWTETVPRFVGTAAIFATAPAAPQVAAFLVFAKLAWESREFFAPTISTRLQRGPLRHASASRDILGIVAAVSLLVAPGAFALAVLLAAELTERYIFFRAVDAPKMPGMPAA